MTVFEYSPFFNENRVFEIKLREAAQWIDEVHVCEADRTFSHAAKPKNFLPTYERAHDSQSLAAKVRYHAVESEGLFRVPSQNELYYDPEVAQSQNFDRWYWELLRGNAAYHNEAAQRNQALAALRAHVTDADIVILSDVDEVLDSRHAQRILDETRKRGIITAKLHYSAFYLNLFAGSNHGMPHFSYRLYVMTGQFLRTMPFTPDYLRKKGIEGGFRTEIHCPEEHLGFHHSWLEPETHAFMKLKAFESNVEDKSMITADYVTKCLSDRKLHYLGAPLYVDNDKPFLRATEGMRTTDLWLRH
jgi:hypothetical protein